MNSIWGFLIQTIEVSAVAVLLLLVKKLLEDKLSPRWQYSIWSVLLLKLLIPAGTFGAYLNFRFTVGLQTVKAVTEQHLASAYSDMYSPMGEMHHFMPYLTGIPHSITDWIFVVYFAGVLFCLLRYALQYIRLRSWLGRSEQASESINRQMEAVASKYGLKPCRVASVPGISSAFVCGVFSPIMAVPADAAELDDKIFLHELLHLKYKDGLQNLIWSFLRALHWCNPFLHYVFQRIGNDMESLCDQRVLELLAGEERREYGKVLLSMTNDRYARAPGTTSVSNGGKSIARRIKAIVRFKKYPKGMLIVSICIGLLLTGVIFTGDRSWDYTRGALANPPDNWKFQWIMAEGRVKRCSTVAGAIDTWVKGAVFDYDVYLAAATPVSRQKELEEMITYDGRILPAERLEKEGFVQYEVYGLKQITDKRYDGQLLLHGEPAVDEKGENIGHHAFLLPISVEKEKGSWGVLMRGKGTWQTLHSGYLYDVGDVDFDGMETTTVKSKIGIFTISAISQHIVENREIEDTYTLDADFDVGSESVSWSGFNQNPKPDAEFAEHSGQFYRIEIENTLTGEERKKIETVGFVLLPMVSADQKFDEEIFGEDMQGGTGGGTCDEGGYYYRWDIHTDWEPKVFHQSCWLYAVEPGNTEKVKDYWGWKLHIYIDSEKVEEIDIKRGERKW